MLAMMASDVSARRAHRDTTLRNATRIIVSASRCGDRLEDVGPVFTKAIDDQMNHGKTTVIEIMCTRELGDPFRRDALSKPVRMLDKYKDFV